MSDGEEYNIDLTPSSPLAPLPTPTTISNRSLRPRRQQGRSSARSSAVSSSRSRSRSGSGNFQLLYPEDPDSPEQLADSSVNCSGRISPQSEEPPDTVESSRTNNEAERNPSAGEASRGGGSGAGQKRKRSPSPVAGSSKSAKRKGKRRALEEIDVPPDDAVGTNEGSSSTHVSSEAAAAVGSSGMTASISQDSSVAEAPAARESQNASLSHAIADDPAAAFERMMSEHSSTSRAYDASADVPPSVNVPLSTRGAVASDVPFLQDFTFSSILGTSACTMTLSPTTDHGPPPHSMHTKPNDAETTPRAEAQPQRPVDTVPIDEVEPLAAYTCPICFSPPSYATITPCGHVLCGECLFTAVKTTIQRGAYTLPAGERMTARCPVCRAPIPGWDGKGGGVIGLRPRAVFSL